MSPSRSRTHDGCTGPNPWQQQSWDARAAGNFIGGGAGCGPARVHRTGGCTGPAARPAAARGGAAGRPGAAVRVGRDRPPWRALHVLFNPTPRGCRARPLLAPLLLASAAGRCGRPCLQPLAALLAGTAFLYCQARILQAAKGIPAWREPLTVPLLVATGLAEGAGLYWAAAAWTDGIPVHTGAWLALRAAAAAAVRLGAQLAPAAQPRAAPRGLSCGQPVPGTGSTAAACCRWLCCWWCWPHRCRPWVALVLQALAGPAGRWPAARCSSSCCHAGRLQPGLRAAAPAGARRR
jgi:hypothetical protein